MVPRSSSSVLRSGRSSSVDSGSSSSSNGRDGEGAALRRAMNWMAEVFESEGGSSGWLNICPVGWGCLDTGEVWSM